MWSFVWKIALWSCLLSFGPLAQAQNDADCTQHALMVRGKTAFDKKQYIKTERLMDRLLAQQPTCHEAYYWKGQCAEQFEDYSAAYEAYSIACQMDQAPYFIARGDLLRTLGTIRLQTPSTCGDCGKQLLPDVSAADPPVVYFKRAVLDYQQALRLNPDSAAARTALQQANEFIQRQL